jgi:exodeoxyribonuclease VII small subunit
MEKTFEASLGELEKIVSQLEEGDLSLEESLKLFEAGVKLSRECQQRLAQAERRIEVLLKDAEGNPAAETLEPDSLREDRPKIRKRINFEEEDEAPV